MKTGSIICLLALSASSGCFNGLLIRPVNTHEPLVEQTVQAPKGWTGNKVAIIDISGMILNARTSGLLGDGENPTSLFREKLEKAAEDSAVKAVVLRINSPGGTVTASDIMYRDLLAFRARTHKPVVACLMDVAASGGYYLAAGCDHIVAHPTTVTGSIGVIMSLYNAHGLFAKLGVESNPIKSGVNKDLANPARQMSDAERAILQAMVDEMHEQFVAVVARGRPIPVETVRALADGRVYSAREALVHKLVDELGYLEDAIEQAKARAGIRDARIIAYDRDEGAWGSIYAGMPNIPRQIAVHLQVPGLEALGLPPPANAAFLYLWQPGVHSP